MRRPNKILVSLLLIAVILACVPLVAFATATEEAAQTCTSIADAAEYLRQAMERRESPVRLVYETRTEVDDNICQRIYDAALYHTGNPTEGDYLAMTIGASRMVYRHSTLSNGVHTVEIAYHLTYYTTAEQEAELETLAADLLADLSLWDASDREKISGIYDWMCQNITYDDILPEDENDMLRYTAYAALKNRTAVCQGYAALFYRLALELGVDARIITGSGNGARHAWNIVQLDGAYYNLDATWDAIWLQAGLPYDYFLQTEKDFKDHERDSKYLTDCFLREFPVCDTATLPLRGHSYISLVAPATCTQDGIEEYFCADCSHCYAVASTALGHNYQEAVTPPTCTQAGYSTFTCSNCSDSYMDKKTTELGHSYSPWEILTEATTLQEGLRERICSVCGRQQREVIARLQPDGNTMSNIPVKQTIIYVFAVAAGFLLLLWGASIIKRRRQKNERCK